MRLTQLVLASALLATHQAIAGVVVAPGPVSNSAGSLISLPGLSAAINQAGGGAGGSTPAPVTVSPSPQAVTSLGSLAQTIIDAGGSLGGVSATASANGAIVTLNNVTVAVNNPDGSISQIKVSIQVDKESGAIEISRNNR